MPASRIRALIGLGAALLMLVVGLSGCQTIGFYAQAVNGQLAVWRASEPIEDVLENEQTDPNLRQRLVLVSEIREFASGELGLPDNDSYRRYADLNRPYVVWNVFAAPELSLVPVRWCFPIAGCVGYRGYFSNEGAEKFAATLKEEGLNGENLDVYVGGVPAYSTLGWFADPVLNTFIGYRDAELARLIFHELAHQVAYAQGDTMFNESFATTVELEGVRRWLEHSGRSDQFEAYLAGRSRQKDFLDLVMRARDRLEGVFEEEISDEEKRFLKVDAYTRLLADYEKLKDEWGGFSGYDRWFRQSLNNAKLGSVAAYNELVPAFQRLLSDHGGDLESFYAAVVKLTKLTLEERREQLQVEATASSDGILIAATGSDVN
jgi:predicted aminopeptidase